MSSPRKISGIYKIVNKTNGKYYVGSSNDVYCRWSGHKSALSKQKHRNGYLQNSWNKHGESAFNVLVVESDIPEQNLLLVEQKYLDIAKSERDKCYNLNFLAEKVEMTPEMRKKISEASMGKKGTRLGATTSKETKKKSQEACRIKTVYRFQNTETGEVFIGNPAEFKRAHKDIRQSSVWQLVNDVIHAHKSWIVLPPSPTTASAGSTPVVGMNISAI